VNNRTISIGGNSVREHFNPLNNFSSMLESEQGPETCNSYNMLRLTKMLFSGEPNGKYMDYYERTLYNHILSSQHPGSGGFVYFTPIRPQHYRVYSQPDEGFWCCVGTGMENHGKYGEMIYSHSGNDLYVNLFIASNLNWKEKGISLIQTNNFPFQEESRLQIKINQPKMFRLFIRQPSWVKDGQFTLTVNGKPVIAVKNGNSYVSVSRKWNPNDKIVIKLPMKDELQHLPDQSAWVSVVHGPIVLAAATDTTNLKGLKANGSRFGHVASGPIYEMNKAPLLIDNGEDLAQNLVPVNGQPLTYHISNLVYQQEYKNLKLVPFFQVHDTRYMIYWPIAKAGDIRKREQELAEEDQGLVALARQTVDQVSAGEQQPESDHFIESADSKTGTLNNKHWRSASGFFSYKMRFDPSVKTLRIAYYGQEKDKNFTIYINDQKLAHVNMDGSQGDKIVYKSFTIPAELKVQQGTAVVKIAADINSSTGSIFDVRLLR
ncbi:MAG: glycosyl hydrolase, partial [Sphingobacteriaceae bacterium]